MTSDGLHGIRAGIFQCGLWMNFSMSWWSFQSTRQSKLCKRRKFEGKFKGTFVNWLNDCAGGKYNESFFSHALSCHKVYLPKKKILKIFIYWLKNINFLFYTARRKKGKKKSIKQYLSVTRCCVRRCFPFIRLWLWRQESA